MVYMIVVVPVERRKNRTVVSMPDITTITTLLCLDYWNDDVLYMKYSIVKLYFKLISSH